MRIKERVSTDGGKTWKVSYPVFTTNKALDPDHFNRGIRVHRDVWDDANGNLYFAYYTFSKGDTAGSAEIAISRDHGTNWHRYSTIFPADGTRTFNEVGISRAVDVELVAVVRTKLGTKLDRLYTARSSDDGLTWSKGAPLPITRRRGNRRRRPASCRSSISCRTAS